MNGIRKQCDQECMHNCLADSLDDRLYECEKVAYGVYFRLFDENLIVICCIVCYSRHDTNLCSQTIKMNNIVHTFINSFSQHLGSELFLHLSSSDFKSQLNFFSPNFSFTKLCCSQSHTHKSSLVAVFTGLF